MRRRLALAAKVVEVERAVAAVAIEVALRRAAERKRDAVVGAQVLRHRMRDEAQIGGELLRPAQRCGAPAEHHRLRPRLVVEVQPRVDRVGIGHRVAEHAEAGLARLRLPVQLDLGFDPRVGAEPPLDRAGQALALAARRAQQRIELLRVRR